MSRVADALARASAKRGGGVSVFPGPDAVDLFPAELVTPDMAAEVDYDIAPPPVVDRLPASTGSMRGWVSVPQARHRPAFRPDLVEKLAVENGASSAVVEEFRKLAATLHHAQGVHKLKVVMVTSAAGGEGKSLTAVNLALTLSESYRRRVLLIDADLRKPTLHGVFNVPNSSGLLTVLKSGSELNVASVEVSPRLVLMTSGGVTPDPVGVLTSDTLVHLLRHASESFDWVLIDTPPAALVPDSSLLAPSVDGVLLVVDAFRTPHSIAQRAIDAVGRDKILGVILNHAEHSPSTYASGQGGH